MKFKIVYTALCFFCMHAGMAQEKFNGFKLEHITIHGGLNLGGVTPTSLPPEIRKIEGYKPVSPFYIGVEVPFYSINKKIDLLTGVNLKSRSMQSSAFVENFRGMINLENTPYQNIFGYFTGYVDADFNNWYLEIPLSIRYSFHEKWKGIGGMSFSRTISRSFEGSVSDAYIRLGAPTTVKIPVPHATFKTSEQIRTFDIGGHVGAAYALNDSWNVRGLMSYGFVNVLNDPLENSPVFLHNVFFSLSAGYVVPWNK